MPGPDLSSANLVHLGLALIFGYLCGSIPFGLILTRMAGGPDVRSIGSGNIGATNVLRTGRKDLAAATLLLDALKGTAAVLIAAQWGVRPALFAAAGAVLGHLYPVWLKFRGGKGVATFLGIALGLAWPVALVFSLVWLGIAFVTRYSSAASLVATFATPVAFWFTGFHAAAVVTAILAAILWWKHRENIARLRAGTEGKIGQKS